MRRLLGLKRGFFFSLMTFLLLFSIFLFSADYLSRSKQLQKSLADSRISNKIVYLHDDIAYGALEELTGIKINSITRIPASIEVNFSGGMVDGRNYSGIASRYAQFVSDNFSIFSNAQVEMVNFTSGFYIRPFGSRYLLEDNGFRIRTENYSALRGIRVSIILGAGALSTNTTPADSGDREIGLRVLNNGNLIYDETSSLNPTALNPSFLLAFAGGGTLQARFGNYGNGPGEFIINMTGLPAEIDEILVEYDPTISEVTAEAGFLRVYSPIGGLNKEGSVVIKRG